MANTSAVYARIDAQLKENAEAILAQLGITPDVYKRQRFCSGVSLPPGRFTSSPRNRPL